MGAHRYPEEFRREAVELYKSSERPRSEVAKSLGIADGTLVAWIAERADREAPGALDDAERAELVRLRAPDGRSRPGWGSQP
jgi:transposase